MISVCYTSARPHLVAQQIQKWIDSAYDRLAIEFVVTLDSKFFLQHKDAIATIPHTRVFQNHGRPCCVDGWNLAARKARGDIFIQVSDDLHPPHHWDLLIHNKLNNGDIVGVLAISDGLTARTDFLPHFIITRRYYNEFGYMFHDAYWSMWSDNEASAVAHHRGVVVNGLDIHFSHTHGQIRDDVKAAHEGVNYGTGNNVFNFRKQNGFQKWKYPSYIGDDGDSDGMYSPNWRARLAIYWANRPKTADHYLGLHVESLRRRRELFGQLPAREEFQVLIPTLPQRKPFLDILTQELARQGIGFVVDDRVGVSVGDKRNDLITRATAPYCTFVDDDDWISHHYGEWIADTLVNNKMSLDVVLYDVLTTVNNEPPRGSVLTFDLGNQNLADCFLRVPNHLMVWKRETAAKERFQSINRGEDSDWANRMTRHAHRWARIHGLLYFYEYLISNTTTQK